MTWVQITENNIFEDNPFLKEQKPFGELDSKELKFCVIYAARHSGPARDYANDEQKYRELCAILSGYFIKKGKKFKADSEGLALARMKNLPSKFLTAIDFIKLFHKDLKQEEKINEEIKALEAMSQKLRETMNEAKFSKTDKKSEITVAGDAALGAIDKERLPSIRKQIKSLESMVKEHSFNDMRFLENIEVSDQAEDLDLSLADQL